MHMPPKYHTHAPLLPISVSLCTQGCRHKRTHSDAQKASFRECVLSVSSAPIKTKHRHQTRNTPRGCSVNPHPPSPIGSRSSAIPHPRPALPVLGRHISGIVQMHSCRCLVSFTQVNISSSHPCGHTVVHSS